MTERKRYTIQLTLTRSQHKRLLVVANAQGWTPADLAGYLFSNGLSRAYRKIAGGTDTYGQTWEQEFPGHCANCGENFDHVPGLSPDGVICQGCDTILELEVHNATH